jgi:hypothetical protein
MILYIVLLEVDSYTYYVTHIMALFNPHMSIFTSVSVKKKDNFFQS